MKNILYNIVPALIMMLSFCSCSDFLEADNKSAGGSMTDSETYFRTKEGLEAFRAYAYSSLKELATSLDINDDGTDLYMPCRGQGASVFQDYSLTAETEGVKNYYVACTGLINNANGLVYYSGENNPQYRLEGLFLRAYGYYLMTQHFGAVPYSDKYIQDANRNYPRTDLETIYTNSENDLIEVINSGLLPEISHDGTVNKRAAQALLAKIYLAHGWDCNTSLVDASAGTYTVNSNENFIKAAEMAEAAVAGINLSQQTFEQKWLPSNENTNPETFFSAQYEKAGWPGDISKGGHELSIYYCHYYGDVNMGQKYTTSNKALNTRSLAMWEKGDTRWDATFMTTMYQYDTRVADWTERGYFAYYNTALDKNTLPIFAYFAPTYVTKEEFEAYLTAHKSQFVKESTHTKEPHANLLLDGEIYVYNFNADGSFKAPKRTQQNLSDNNRATSLEISPCVKKWDDPTAAMGGKTISYRDIVLLHASEIYLTAAEAYLMAGNEPAAMAKINDVRDRAGAPHLNTLADYDISVKFANNFTLLDLLLDERARECYAEQTRWMDLRRTRQLVRYNVAYNPFVTSVEDMSNVDGEIKWYHPIPTAEISSNDGITDEDQNPGY